MYSLALTKGAASIVVPAFSSQTNFLHFHAMILTGEKIQDKQTISIAVSVFGTLLPGISYNGEFDSTELILAKASPEREQRYEI